MDLNTIIGNFISWVNGITHSSWFGTAATIVVVAIVCAAVSRITSITLRKILKSDKGPLPSVSIFLNIARVIIWLIGIGIVLSSCFNVNLGAAITALGIGGIAISLGFQGTLSNLIGGLQIIIIGLVEPGDHIRISTYEGIVRDVTWRHTTITTPHDEKVIIPNSVINSQALVKLPPQIYVLQNLSIPLNGSKPIDDVLIAMEQAVNDAVAKVAVIAKKPKIRLIGMDAQEYKAELSFVVESGIDKSEVIDVAMKAIDSAENEEK